jgi:glycosyltransferase involved in cell wall biosynthesis
VSLPPPLGKPKSKTAAGYGSVQEVIDEGVTGFIVDNEEDAVAAVARVSELDRHLVRATFERRFTARRMAADYLRFYEKLLREETREALMSVRMLDGAKTEATEISPAR